MADSKDEKNGAATAAADPSPVQIQAKLISQYIKDLSFENPNIRRLLIDKGDTPNLKIEVNVQAERIENDLYESSISFKATAANKTGMIYVIECVYAGMMKIESIPEQALEPFMLISGPTMLFPFLRRLVADVTREGGFPPLMLDPIDFAGLYFNRQKQAAAGSGPAKMDA